MVSGEISPKRLGWRSPRIQPEVGERGTYDAWNRPVNLTSNFTRFTYDGLGRLVLLDSGTGKRRFTYTPDWQLLEKEITPQEGSPYRYEYIWGIRGQDDLICREKYDSQSNLLERLYSLSDANGNIAGLISEAEDYLNRLITYDPYGTPTDENDFRQLFGGYYYDSDTGLYLVRNRIYHPKLGRWLTKDPLGMVDGPNLYEYCAGDPVSLIDPSGTVSFWDDPLDWAYGSGGAIWDVGASNSWLGRFYQSSGQGLAVAR